MIVINAVNVNDALFYALGQLRKVGVQRESRNGPVIAFPEAVTTVYARPQERVLFSPVRNANPAFHLFESLWMLAGRNDVAFPSGIVKNMANFSDDGKTFHGAYGFRWRQHFATDQLEAIINELRANPDTRRAVLAMWDGHDFAVGSAGGKDVPCNTHIYFDMRGGKLNMLVCCRSNDIIWGCYGANAVHMSVLQEYIAAGVGVEVGKYSQMSNDLHMYTDMFSMDTAKRIQRDIEPADRYNTGEVTHSDIVTPDTFQEFNLDLEEFFDRFDRKGMQEPFLETVNYRTDFFKRTVVPMGRAWLQRKFAACLAHAAHIEADDWRIAMLAWLDRNHSVQGGVK